MLRLPSSNDAKRIRNLFQQAGYTEENVSRQLGAAELPSSGLRNTPRLLERTRETSPLNTLLRWFWIGIPQEVRQTADTLPRWFIPAAIEYGLLRRQAQKLVPCAMFLPVYGFLIASDHSTAMDSADAQLVLWPNPTSKFLARFTVRRPSRATLDLGTGCGILSLCAASHSEIVIGTDLNVQATMFAAFNARLNAIENVDFLTGDAFEPVVGRKFDLICCNPPFFITPSNSYLFCDNSLDLDNLCRKLVREAPAYLNEDGYFQMLCEWAQVQGQAWQERIAEWFEGSECDVWVMKGLTQDPGEYAQHRIQETTTTKRDTANLFDTYMDYYRLHQLEAIHDGLIVLRRRTASGSVRPNWVRIEDVPQTATGILGETVLSTFAANDFLQANGGDEELLAVTPRLSPNARLEQICEAVEGRWQPASLTLRLVRGFPFQLSLQPAVANFVGGCDGVHTADDLIRQFAIKADAPLETVRRECLAILRIMIERGFVLI